MRIIAEYTTEELEPGSITFEGKQCFNSIEDYQNYNDAIKDYDTDVVAV